MRGYVFYFGRKAYVYANIFAHVVKQFVVFFARAFRVQQKSQQFAFYKHFVGLRLCQMVEVFHERRAVV